MAPVFSLALALALPASAQRLTTPKVPAPSVAPIASALPAVPLPQADPSKPLAIDTLRRASLALAKGQPLIKLNYTFDLAKLAAPFDDEPADPHWDFDARSPATLQAPRTRWPLARPAPPKPSSFLEPAPNRPIMRALAHVNRWVMLTGIPLLNKIPVVRDWPLVRGYFRLREIDFPEKDRARLARAVNSDTAAFLAPNHPEFATDWMMDKELSTHVAPYMAAWAAREIVRAAPWLWLRNNLISNDGGEAAKEYSVRSALEGHATLLHPEGAVHWTGDYVHRLFPGVAELAVRTSLKTAKPTYIAPVVWKFRFVGDVSGGLLREIAYLEKALSLPTGEGLELAARFGELEEGILAQRMKQFGYAGASEGDFFARQEAFRAWLIDDLAGRHFLDAALPPAGGVLRVARAMRTELGRSADEARRAQLASDIEKADEARRLGEFSREIYGGERLTQEQIYESLKRDRDRLVRGGFVEAIGRMLPRPVGPRIAHVGVPAPIRVLKAAAAGGKVYEALLLEYTRERMQAKLDEINRRIAPETARYAVANPLR
ncbi:MAG: hypothetical protein HY925_12420 [Elusimicrobia bacterium]|nr:hypothetical protein [Elusimicrobiota bacterium]